MIKKQLDESQQRPVRLDLGEPFCNLLLSDFRGLKSGRVARVIFLSNQRIGLCVY